MTRQEVVNLIAECEKNGQFDQHVDPIDWDNALPVDGSFNYLRKGLKQFLQHTFIVKPFTNKVAKKDFLVEVKGKENLKGTPPPRWWGKRSPLRRSWLYH